MGVLRLDPDLLQDDRFSAMSSADFRSHIMTWLRWGRGPARAPRPAAVAGLDGKPLVYFERRCWSKDAYPTVRRRDRGLCRYCGKPGRTIDHVKPRCQGGDDREANLVVACGSCNSRKNGRTPEQAGMALLPCPEVIS